MALEEDFTVCCTGLIVIVIIVIILWILVKGAKVLGYIGQWRTGSALKHMSREGVTIHQGSQYQPPITQYQPQPPQYQSPPQQETPMQSPTRVRKAKCANYCPFCGTPRIQEAAFCESCGKKLP